MSIDPRTPVIIGVGQRNQHPADPSQSVEPVRLMSEAVESAIDDSQSVGLAQTVQWTGVVQGAWRYSDPAKLIADRLGFTRSTTALTTEGGQAPQATLNTLCQRIAAGQLDCAVLAGGETIWSRRRLRRRGERLVTTDQTGVEPGEIVGDKLNMSTAFEVERGADQPIVIYPIFESAIRANRGETIESHRDRISQLWERFNQVATCNPYAWRSDKLSADQIRNVSPANRMVGFPYTKAMNSNWDLDQASAVILCSAATAAALAVPLDRWVFPWAGGHANDTAHVSNRRDLHSSPAIAAIGQAVFDHCNITVSDINHVDLYSCFPSAVQISAKALGLDLHRQLTVTGGLTFAGGPLNNYVGHSIAVMVETVRDAGGVGLVTANGGYATKHAIGLYRSDPPGQPFVNFDCQAAAEETEPIPADTSYVGDATIEGYTVMNTVDGPTHAVAALRTPVGARTWARLDSPQDLADLMSTEGVGLSATINADGAASL